MKKFNSKQSIRHYKIKLADKSFKINVVAICQLKYSEIFLMNSQNLYINYLFENRKMPELLQFNFILPKQTEYDPIQYSYSIGQKCKVCAKKILHHQAITACECYRYCHQKCLLTEFNQQNVQKVQQSFQCTGCKKNIQVIYKVDVLNKPHINKTNIILIIISLILLTFTIYISLIYQQDMSILALSSILLAFQSSTLAYAVINTFMVKQYTALSIKSTNLCLIISAFFELENDFNEQITNNQLIR